jgi:hypothetical protein
MRRLTASDPACPTITVETFFYTETNLARREKIFRDKNSFRDNAMGGVRRRGG